MPDLATPLRFIKRIGDRVAGELARKGILTVEDLLYHLPFRYEDRLHPQPIAALQAGTTGSVIAEVRGSALLRTSRMPLFELTVGQGTSTLKAMWFNGAYLKDRFPLGSLVALYGPLEASRSTAGRLKMLQPQFELLPNPNDPTASPQALQYAALEVDRIVPVYETTGGTTAWGARLTSRWLRRVLFHLLQALAQADLAPADRTAAPQPPATPNHSSTPQPSLACHPEQSEGPASLPPPPSPATTPSIPDPLPAPLRARLNLPGRLDALRAVHFPPPGTPMADLIAASTPAHRRLVFEEFFFLELGLELKRRRLLTRQGTPFRTDSAVRDALKQVLPFHPTAAQKRVLGEIAADMRRPQPMRRLLQGDVGSGKTIVAMQAALIAIENGLQVALMAPTEILATQHFLAARKLLAHARSPRTGRPYRLALLTGSLDERSKRDTRHRIASGEIDLAIGTHALFEDTVTIPRLGLAIIDEQHRFGVEQRLRLMRKPTESPTQGDPPSPSQHVPLVVIPQGPASPRSTTTTLPLKATQSDAPPPTPGEPDTLVMTATPIPRTLALTLYGDLDVSVLDELPPGRTPITTRRTSHARIHDVWTFVRKQVAAGRQAYVVYPVIEGATDDQPQLDFATDPDLTPETPNHPPPRPKPGAPHLASEMWDPPAPPQPPSSRPRTARGAAAGAESVPPHHSSPRSSPKPQSPPSASHPAPDPVTARPGAPHLASEMWVPPSLKPPPQRQAGHGKASLGEPAGAPHLASEMWVPPTLKPPPRSKAGRGKALLDEPASASHALRDPLAAKLITAVETPKSSRSKTKRKSQKKPAADPLFPKTPLRAAADMYDELRHGPLHGLRLGLLHGRLSAAEKDITMRQFNRGEIDVLIATTVIEVGVDVPNATLMVIDHAERFGLSQLHQLRGRVGRGAGKSFCILVTGDRVSPAAEARLDAMVATTDGFELAEIDLQQRGPGEFFGTRQAGLPELRVANLLRDRSLLELARTEAARFAAAPDPSLTPEEIETVWAHLRSHWQRRYALVEA